MTGESDNLPTGGTDTAQPLTLDDAAALNIFDPHEDTEEEEQKLQSTDEPGETESGQEADEIDATAGEDDPDGEDAGEAAEAEPKSEPDESVQVTVNGEKLALSELKSGYMRQADYSRKTQEVANSRRDLEALTGRVTQSVNAVAEFLSHQIPEPPHPSLAMTDPTRFVQQQAAHQAAVQQVQAILSQAGTVKDVVSDLTQQQKSELIASENAKLEGLFPTTSTKEGRKAFFDDAAATARDLGYSNEEIATVTDHRLFALAHYARLGMAAEKAKATAKAKVEGKPPVAPPKRQKSADGARARRNQEAMKRLARTGSIHDALAIDFD